MTSAPEPRIPERYRARCELCSKDDVDVRAEGSHQFCSGWVKNRTQGGGHGISLINRDNRWAHGWCVDNATRGFQGKLFA